MAALDTLRIGQVNTPCIATSCIERFMDGPADRLRKARIAAGYSSASKAAAAFGWTESAYRHHENGTRGFDIEAAKRYGRAFKINPGTLLALDLITPARATPGRLLAGNEVEIVGRVAAGIWREPDSFEEGEQRTVVFPPSPFPGARRFALEVEGYSMDRVYQPGVVLDCVSIFDVSIDPEPDDHVIVERIRSDGRRELTVKKYALDEQGHPWLMPESTKPEFQSPFRVDDDADPEMTVQVIAFVIGDYNPRGRFRR